MSRDSGRFLLLYLAMDIINVRPKILAMDVIIQKQGRSDEKEIR